ncbi:MULTISPECIES: DUF4013 domain-containing protein [Halorussus]|uniref:DUF4013 domain-containing protein n=1 Tax=Halorussus TaxID=1070314 RepID=UPI000E219029|nr:MULTISPECIES: DUF4013 domain-containing protein [Halorussus]NHN59386.1 DUF4013 domain-containing protein [Halorussus sp. JP-T4]
MLREALTYPVRGEEADETLVVGAILAVAAGLLTRLGVLAVLALVPVVLLAGYALAVVRESAASEGETPPTADAPPRFADFRGLAADGARALAVAVGYLFVPAAALAVTVGGAGAGARPEAVGTTLFVFGAGTVVLFVSLSFAYLLPAALAGVAETGRLRSGVDRGRLIRSARDGRYFVGWVAALVVAGLAVVGLGSLAALGRPGEVVALAAGFYVVVVVARLVGRASS